MSQRAEAALGTSQPNGSSPMTGESHETIGCGTEGWEAGTMTRAGFVGAASFRT